MYVKEVSSNLHGILTILKLTKLDTTIPYVYDENPLNSHILDQDPSVELIQITALIPYTYTACPRSLVIFLTATHRIKRARLTDSVFQH